MKRILGLALLGALAAGCSPYGYYGYHAHYWGGPHLWHRHGWVATGPRPIFAIGFHPALDDDRAAIEEAEQTSLDSGRTIPHLPARVTAPEPEHVAFDSGAALAAIHAVDLAPCVARGAVPGYGHAKITFGADGRATKVVIDSPPAMPADAVACVGELLGAATVPEFDGGPMTVGSAWLVK
jgi:hypothetical protein